MNEINDTSLADDAGLKASILIEALPFLRRYAGRTFVVKYGGHAMGDTAAAASFARDVVLLKGRRRVLVEVSLELLTRRRANIVVVD